MNRDSKAERSLLLLIMVLSSIGVSMTPLIQSAAIALYPGSFDPITNGHVDILTRASGLFQKVIIAIVNNPSKNPFVPLDTRLKLVQQSVQHLSNVDVITFEGLTIKLAEKYDAKVIIRGLRAVSDFEFEFMMSQMNKNLNPHIETFFMMADKDYHFLSSSMVREVARLDGDVSQLVPACVDFFLKHHFKTL
jgi:pantetheine-phosphate adenylyltransferase